MPNYAAIDGINVINTVRAKSLEEAEFATGLTCIEYTTEEAEVGGTYENGRFIQVKPFPSWILDNEFHWQAPVPRPENKFIPYTWDEATLSWVEMPPSVE